MQEVYRVLQTGGCFGILELTQPQNPFLRMGHKLYLKGFLPILGKWITNNKSAYSYLQNSIQTFIAPSDLEQMMIDSHFVKTSIYPLAGGIATIIMGYKN